jgi:hypothetical protein
MIKGIIVIGHCKQRDIIVYNDNPNQLSTSFFIYNAETNVSTFHYYWRFPVDACIVLATLLANCLGHNTGLS